MGSKQLDSILGGIPSATITGEKQAIEKKVFEEAPPLRKTKPNYEESRLVARIPAVLKEEIRLYIRNHPGETEKTVVLKALQKLGFSVQSDWLVDRRSLR